MFEGRFLFDTGREFCENDMETMWQWMRYPLLWSLAGFYGFVGPNGAGKSTTMNVMTGYIAASSGTVMIDGHDMLKEPPCSQKHVWLSAGDSARFIRYDGTGNILCLPRIKACAEEGQKRGMWKKSGKNRLQDVGDRLIRNLSKGYKQRGRTCPGIAWGS